jgi:hypothetical protein
MKNILLLTIFLSFNSYALTDLTGLEIMQKVEDRDDGNSMISTLNMTLIDKHGKKRVREMLSYSKDIDKETKYTAMFFLNPSDVKNTAFLTFDYRDCDKEDDQWMYLSALKKTKRIPASDKDSSFMGSDFSYADLTDRMTEKYSYKILKESVIKRKTGKVPVWVIESIPKTQKTIDMSGYKKAILYVRKDNFVIVRGKLIPKKIGITKYLDVRKLEKIDGIWVATQTSMITKQGKKTLHKTLLTSSNIKMNPEIDKDIFTIRSIEKGL